MDRYWTKRSDGRHRPSHRVSFEAYRGLVKLTIRAVHSCASEHLLQPDDPVVVEHGPDGKGPGSGCVA
jgi:hypothetical protein